MLEEMTAWCDQQCGFIISYSQCRMMTYDPQPPLDEFILTDRSLLFSASVSSAGPSVMSPSNAPENLLGLLVTRKQDDGLRDI
jgi:hypothetical protein